MSADPTSAARIVTGELHRVRRGRGKGFSAEPPPGPSRRPARVALTLALAYTIQRAIDRGEIRDQAEAARRLGVTRARITQILGLTLLAADIQEEILFPDAVGSLKRINERAMREAVRTPQWADQRSVLVALSTNSASSDDKP
jgi:hypothetical protein